MLSASAADTNKIPDLRPPLAEMPPSFWETQAFAILIVVVIVAVVLPVMWAVLWKKTASTLPTDALARQALEALRNHPDDAGTTAGVALHLRRFVQAALGLPAGEMTSRELLTAMRGMRDNSMSAQFRLESGHLKSENGATSCNQLSTREEMEPPGLPREKADCKSAPPQAVGDGNSGQAHATLPADLIDVVEKLLEECDARRFAPVPPEGASGMVNRALEIVARIDAWREPRKPAA